MINHLIDLMGIETQSVSHKERILSGVGAFLGIFLVFLVSQFFVSDSGLIIIVASMGSSAVLLFAVPHGSLSQPWPLLGGHLISAFIGVACAQLIDNQLLAASCAVGLAVTAMYYLRCTHPPGGATALGAVVGGQTVHELGFQFVITPVLLNTTIILIFAVAFNALFKWRSYPVHLANLTSNLNKKRSTLAKQSTPSITHEGFVYALSQIDTFIDVDESDLLRIYELATQHTQDASQDDLEIIINACYSNGEYGSQWSVRQIIDISNNNSDSEKIVSFKVVAGAGRRKSGSTTLSEFMNWAHYEVFRDEDNWRKVY